MTNKQYISAQQLLEDSFNLAVQILESDFRPNFIVGVWRGGTPVGIAVQEFLDYFGVHTDHISIRTSLYKGIGKTKRKVRVHGLNYLIKNINQEDSLLIVDDVYDSGRSIDAIFSHLERLCRNNLPRDIRVAAPYFKPGNNITERVPDYCVHRSDEWLVFPHELKGLSVEEITRNKDGIARIFERALAQQSPRQANGL